METVFLEFTNVSNTTTMLRVWKDTKRPLRRNLLHVFRIAANYSFNFGPLFMPSDTKINFDTRPKTAVRMRVDRHARSI